MSKWMEQVTQWIYAYGKESAGAPSQHGSYEAPVPQALRDEEE